MSDPKLHGDRPAGEVSDEPAPEPDPVEPPPDDAPVLGDRRRPKD